MCNCSVIYLSGKMNDIIGVRSFVLITGASRGFGRALALEMGKVVGAGSTLLLMARNMADLETTKAIVRDARPGLAVELVSIDLETANRETFDAAVRSNYGSGDHSVAVVIHNAGTLGQDGRKITVRKLENMDRGPLGLANDEKALKKLSVEG